MEVWQKLDNKEMAIVEQRKQQLTEHHSEYLQGHPELQDLLNDFLSSTLLNKPDNIFTYARDFFSKFNLAPVRTKPLIVLGPSGVGKSTILTKLMQRFPETFEFSVSTTTRMPRPGEQEGVHYFFVTREEFQQQVEEGKFLEWAEVHLNLYGTSRETVESSMTKGKVCVLDIDVQGALQVYKKGLDCNYIFVMPPSMAELERRLKERSTEDDSGLRVRLRNAAGEIETAKSNPQLFKDFIVNEEVDSAMEEFYHKLTQFYDFLLEL
jgi:guanylate kinase